MRALVHQLHFVMVVIIALAVESEVQYAYDIHGFQPVVPFPFLSLLTDGEGGVVDAAVLEVLLLAALHLHQYLFSPLILAIHIEYRPAVCLAATQMFRVQVGQAHDLVFGGEQAVDEAYQQFLVHLRAEQFLEPKVGVRIDIAVAQFSISHISEVF